MTFRIGQKVVCVDDTLTRADGIRELSKGVVYTISWVGMTSLRNKKYLGVQLVGIVRDEPDWIYINNAGQPFGAHRFRPIVERETDISFAHEILRNASKPVKIPATVSSADHRQQGE